MKLPAQNVGYRSCAIIALDLHHLLPSQNTRRHGHLIAPRVQAMRGAVWQYDDIARLQGGIPLAWQVEIAGPRHDQVIRRDAGPRSVLRYRPGRAEMTADIERGAHWIKR